MISLIATVFNEEENVKSWLDSLLSQKTLSDEIVIVDGGSTDKTWFVLQDLAKQHQILKVFQCLGNISFGRNSAIKRASGEIIVVADAGCFYDYNWFDQISSAFKDEGVDWAATAYGPKLNQNDKMVSHLIAAATTPAPVEFINQKWLPSSRSVAFKKSLWQQVGGYPEWLPICEDIIFDLKILKINKQIKRINQPLVFWQPRKNLWLYAKQLFFYTRGDGHGKLWLERQLIRYGVYGGSLVLLGLSLFISWSWFWLLIVGSLIYLSKFFKRWFVFTQNKRFGFKLIGLFLLPGVVICGDLAKMLGWVIGVYQRKTKKIKFEPWRTK